MLKRTSALTATMALLPSVALASPRPDAPPQAHHHHVVLLPACPQIPWLTVRSYVIEMDAHGNVVCAGQQNPRR